MKQTRRPGMQQAASGGDVQQNGGSQTERGGQTERERERGEAVREGEDRERERGERRWTSTQIHMEYK